MAGEPNVIVRSGFRHAGRTGDMVRRRNLGSLREFGDAGRCWWRRLGRETIDGATRVHLQREVKLALTGNGVSFSFPPPSNNLPRCQAASAREAGSGIESCPSLFLPVPCDGSIPDSSVAVHSRRLPFLPSLPPQSVRLWLPFLCRAFHPLVRCVSS